MAMMTVPPLCTTFEPAIHSTLHQNSAGRVSPCCVNEIGDLRLSRYFQYKTKMAEVSVPVAGPIFKGTCSSNAAKNSAKSWRSTKLVL